MVQLSYTRSFAAYAILLLDKFDVSRLMKIPYGESNFRTVITQGYQYIDKTPYIAKLEVSGKCQFLLRPRRFGKSLFISALEYYTVSLRMLTIKAVLFEK